MQLYFIYSYLKIHKSNNWLDFVFFPLQSHYSSSGPEFNRVLFNFGGQSPLILYYLQMHELTGISKTSRQIKIKFTEILKEPYPFLSFVLIWSVSKMFKTFNFFNVSIKKKM